MKTEIRVTYELTTKVEPFLDGVGQLLDAARRGDEIHLNFEPLVMQSAKRSRPFNLIVLANVILGQTGDCPIEVTFPDNDPAKLLVIRSGIVFAVLNRPGVALDYGFFNPDGSEVNEEWKRLWTAAWTPVQPMLGSILPDEDHPRILTSREFLSNSSNAKKASRVIVDPHLEVRGKLLFHAANSLAGPWIRSIIPDSEDPKLKKRREIWQGPITSRVIGEPLLNIADHSLSRPPESASLDHQVRSMVLLARTDGGGGKSHPRLQVIVTDTGYGAINTHRPKRKRRIPQVGNETGEEVLTAAVTGRAQTMNDPGLIWARTGFEIAIQEAGTPLDDDIEHEFTILAGDGLNGDVVWVSVHADGSSETGRHRGIPFVGTTVFASLPIPHGQRKNSEAELESSGGVLTPA